MHLLFNNEITRRTLMAKKYGHFLSIHTVTFTFDSLEQQYNDLYYLTRYT